LLWSFSRASSKSLMHGEEDVDAEDAEEPPPPLLLLVLEHLLHAKQELLLQELAVYVLVLEEIPDLLHLEEAVLLPELLQDAECVLVLFVVAVAAAAVEEEDAEDSSEELEEESEELQDVSAVEFVVISEEESTLQEELCAGFVVM